MTVQTKIIRSWQVLKTGVRKHWKYLQYLFMGLALLLVGRTLYANWSSLSSFDWQLNYLGFAVSLLLISVAILSLAGWWTLSIRLLQAKLGWKQGIRIWVFAQITKYLPGGVLNYATRVIASDRSGVPKSCTAQSLVIETVLRIQAAVIVFLVSLPFWPATEWSTGELLALGGVLALGFLVLHPYVLNKGVNVALRLFRRPAVDMTSLRYRHILGLLAGHILTVAGCGAAFYLMVLSVHSVPAYVALPMAGMFAISVISGFLNPLTPHGLGTREGLLTYFLGHYLPLSVAAVVSLLARLWVTIAELIGLVLVGLLLKG